MLKLKHTHHLGFPHITFTPLHSMKLSVVPLDNDELAQAIDNDPIDHDNNWQLTNQPDTEALEEYWTTVVAELKDDPEQIIFAEQNDNA
ncbi:hypothetical protein H7Y40_02980 [Pedobacter sp.]|nr:hypothetical protein [Candidatus Saccharibacteria bacterium]